LATFEVFRPPAVIITCADKRHRIVAIQAIFLNWSDRVAHPAKKEFYLFKNAIKD